MADHVHFFIIGAQKGGTTALFQYLRGHPGILMPRHKETAFFFREELYERGLDWYFSTFFGNPTSYRGRTLGEASPQYMYDLKVPGRISRHFQDAKLIALLRNPVDRAYSAFRMQARRGVECRSFDEAVSELIQVHETRGRTEYLDDEGNNYLAAGCYATLLRCYLECFDISQLKIVVSEDLLLKPRETLRDILYFLNVDAEYLPLGLGKRYHVGGQVRFETVQRLVRHPNILFKAVLRFFPFAHRQAFMYWLEQWNIKAISIEGPRQDTHRRLVEWYTPEVNDLVATFGINPNWRDFSKNHA